MIYKIKKVDEFIKEIADYYPPRTKINTNFESLKTTNFLKNECLFVWDVRIGEILFSKGFENLLGISDENVTLKAVTDLFHPDDKELIFKIGQAAVRYSIKYPASNKEHCMHISHRIKKANGDYIEILAESTPYRIDSNDYITQFIVKFDNLSFIESSEVVQYKFIAKDLNIRLFHDNIFQNNKSIFTSRELDIIKNIQKGYTNPQIAERLIISKHTVSTHRKKIMKKSGCHSVIELVLFCKKNGII